MRGQRDIRAAEKAPATAGKSVIDISEYAPKRIPSAKWCELIKKVYEADPLLCPNCHGKMRIVALINESEVVERILRHLNLLHLSVKVCPPTPSQAPPKIPPAEWLDGPFPDYESEQLQLCAND